MKFKSMNPKGYLDCQEYRPGGKYNTETRPLTTFFGQDEAEMCINCGTSMGQHCVNECPIWSEFTRTPTPLRGRGRPAKQEEEKEEEQTYYYGYPLDGRPEDDHHASWIGAVKMEQKKGINDYLWFTLYDDETGERRTADELFSDPTFELYGGPDAPEGWNEEEERRKDEDDSDRGV